MKIIGIINKYGKSKGGHDTAYSYLDISKKIINAGGYPIGINLLDNMDETKKLLSKLNGVVFSGGDDYTDKEIELIRFLYDNDIPTLGICLGMQTMAVAFNGNLVETIGHNNTYHEVVLKENSRISDILGVNKLLVNSRHNFKVLNTDLKVSGMCENVIEAIEDDGKCFFVGVEWHPESLDDDNSNVLFNYFVNAGDNYDIV